ncbi:hypothetical protein C8R47DRAFT_1230257 [Mycena vitilis]|nr:hypothetical protein C8R47DRAFT_1230257 [Mycena vitilis]
MTNQSRSQPQPQHQPQAAQLMMGGMLIVLPVFGMVSFPVAIGQALTVAPAAPAPPVAPAAPCAPAVAAPAPAAAPAPPAAARTPPGAGLPAPLLALLRDGDANAPFLANEVFSAVPRQSLLPIEEETPAPEWYAITRGHFVGVVDQFALSHVAISGVAHGARKAYTTQALALDAFNQALTWGGVQVA